MQINVDPNSVRAYGNSAQEIFAGVQSALEGLVTDVVNVNYKGENAVEFKTGCGNLAAEFGTALNKDMRAIADAVQDSTTNIARALGGGPVIIEFSGGMVTVPAVPPGDGTYSADTAGLEALKGTVNNRLGAITQHLDDNYQRLNATAWTGNAKDQAMQTVSGFTNKAKTKVTETSTTLTNYIERQLETLRAADA